MSEDKPRDYDWTKAVLESDPDFEPLRDAFRDNAPVWQQFVDLVAKNVDTLLSQGADYSCIYYVVDRLVQGARRD